MGQRQRQRKTSGAKGGLQQRPADDVALRSAAAKVERVSRKVTGVLLLLLFSGGLALLAPMTFAQALLDLDPDRTAVEQIRQ